MDQELAAFVDRRFDENSRRLDEGLEENRRHFGVLAEGLRREVQMIAEAHTGLLGEIQEFRRQNDAAHQEILTLVRLGHVDVSQRTARLESASAQIEARLRRLEPD